MIILRFKKSKKNRKKKMKKKIFKFFFAHKTHNCGLKSKSFWLWTLLWTYINASMKLVQKLSDPFPQTGPVRRGGSVKSDILKKPLI